MRPEFRSVGRVLGFLGLAAAGWTAYAAPNLTQPDPTPPSQSQAQRPVFRADVNFITVDAYPLVDGRVVEGLAAADFEVREDGRIQKVESFEFVRANERMTEGMRRDPGSQQQMLDELADPRARVFVAYLDVHNVGIPGAYYSRPAIIEMFHRLLAPNDLIALSTSRNHPRELTFGRTSAVVEQQLTRHWTWQDPDVTVNDAEESGLTMCVVNAKASGGRTPVHPDRPEDSEWIQRRRQDQLLASLEGTIEYLGEVREGRKILFLFSRGWHLFEPNRDLLKPLETPGYVPAKPGVTREPWRNMRIGGSLWEGDKAACEQELIRLANMNNVQRFRQLLRDAAMNNVAIYPVNPSGVGAIDGPNDRLLEMARNTGGTAVGNRNDLVQGVIDVSREFEAYYLLGYASDNQKADGLLRRIEVRVNRPGVQVKARQGYRALTPAAAASKAEVLATPVRIDADRAALDLALDVLATIRVGDEAAFSASRYLKADAAPYLGAPAVFRANPSPRSPVVAVTAPAFRRSERLHIEWPITQPFTSRSARIVGRDGNPVEVPVTLTEREDSGGRMLVADVIPAPLAAGDFVVELTVVNGETPTKTLLAFRVVR